MYAIPLLFVLLGLSLSRIQSGVADDPPPAVMVRRCRLTLSNPH
jgi:hypothetical protein